MALNKKKGSFTTTDPHGETRISGKAGGGASIRVMLLDGTALTINLVDKKMLGQLVFDQVLRKLDLLERDFFGLRYEDDHKMMQWLDLLRPIKKQLKKQPYTMFFRVKFYAVDPLALHRNSKEQFYLQLKEDISAGRLPFPSESAHSILSYVLQADVGDYRSNHEDLHYLQEKGLLILGKDRTAETSIIKLHKLLEGKDPGVAVEKFLRKARELESYGAKFNLVQHKGIPYRMSMSPAGIILYQDRRRTAHFAWRKVLQVSYKQKHFTLRIKSKSSEGGEKTIVYDVESSKLCKEMWEECVERVSFYNDHPTHYKESVDAGSTRSRSPSPPIAREYATINDATPQLEGARQQSLQSSPTHNEQQHENNPLPHIEQQRGGRHAREEDNHVDGGSLELGQMREPVNRAERGERGFSAMHQSQFSHGNGVREKVNEEGGGTDEGRDDDTCTLKQQSKVHNKVQSLPRRLPTGDPMLHHMMQFQSLECPSSRFNLLSECDSPTETTSPIVSTCDEASESPELTMTGHQSLASSEREQSFEGHVRSFSLPQPQTEWSNPERRTGQISNRENLRPAPPEKIFKHKERQDSDRNGREQHNEIEHDHSVSEERDDDSMRDSLAELADLLGREEEVRGEKKEEQNSREEEELPERDKLTDETRRANGQPPGKRNQQIDSQEKAVKQSPLLSRDEQQQKMRRKKQLQKQILLQRQQLKEQKLQQYLEKQKQKQREENADLAVATGDLEKNAERKYTHEHQSRRKHGDERQLEDSVNSSPLSKSHPRDIQSRDRAFKIHSQQSRQDAPSSSRRHSDKGDEEVSKERKMVERDMVRSWAKAQRHKARREPRSSAGNKSQHTSSSPSHVLCMPAESRSVPGTVEARRSPRKQEEQTNPAQPGTPTHSASASGTNLSSSLHTSPLHNPAYPPGEPIYNSLAPKNGDSNTEVGKSSENLPSSPPPPPYKSPSPAHQASMGLKLEVDSPTGLRREVGGSHGAVSCQTQSLNHQRSFSNSTTTPPTPRSGAGSRSTLSHSPQSLGSGNRSPRHTHSFSGGSPMHSANGSTGSPRTPTRAHSYRRGQHSPAKQSPPRRGKDNMRQDGGVTAKPLQSDKSHYEHDQLDVMPINIDPSALKKDDLTIAPHNFLRYSPPYDKLVEDEEEKVVSIAPLSKQPPTQSGTQYKLKTALQEVMTSENLPPPPTHLLEISEQLEDIDYQDLNAPPACTGSKTVPSRAEFDQQQNQQQQKKMGINPEMIAKSLDAPRKASNPNFYPPHIAKFMSRVRHNSTEADDPTQVRSNHSVPENTISKLPDTGGASVNDDVFATVQQRQTATSRKSGMRPTLNPTYDVPRAALGRTVSLENGKQMSHPLVAGSKPRSNTYTGRGQISAMSYSLPRGHTSLMMQQFASDSSRETTPSSPHAQSGLEAGVDHSQRGQQSSDYTQNDVRRTHSRNPPPHGNRAGDSIPSSPTYFTHNHPHRDDTTPSPETKFLNQSFKDHLNSLQPTKGSKGTNIVNWMQQSFNYWNSNKSVPMVKDPRVKISSRPPNRSLHFYEPMDEPQPPIGVLTPTVDSNQAPGQPVAMPHHPIVSRLQQSPHLQPRRPRSAAPVAPQSLGSQTRLPLSSSSTSLQRTSSTSLGPIVPSYPRPTSATATDADNYFVLDV